MSESNLLFDRSVFHRFSWTYAAAPGPPWPTQTLTVLLADIPSCWQTGNDKDHTTDASNAYTLICAGRQLRSRRDTLQHAGSEVRQMCEADTSRLRVCAGS